MELAIAAGVVGVALVAFFAFREKQETARERERTKRVVVAPKPEPAPQPAPETPKPVPAPAPAPAPAPSPVVPDPVSSAPEPAGEFGFWVEGEKVEIVPFQAFGVSPVTVDRGTKRSIEFRLVVPPFSQESRAALQGVLMRPSNPSIYDGGAELFMAVKKVGALPANVARLGSAQVQFIEDLDYSVVRGSLPGHNPIRLHRPDSSAFYLRYHFAFTGAGMQEVVVRAPIRCVDADDEYDEVIEGFLAGPMPNAGYVGNRGMKFNFRIPLKVQ